MLDEVRSALGSISAEVVDLHVWEIGPGYRAAILGVETAADLGIEDIKRLLPERLGIVHVTVEVHRSRAGDASAVSSKVSA
jgi:Co/Zn/Cd efflux system component